MDYEKVMSDATKTAEQFIDDATYYVNNHHKLSDLPEQLKVEMIKIYVDAALRDQHTMLTKP